MNKNDILKSIDRCANNRPYAVDITVHKHIEYANNLIITQASIHDHPTSFIGYSIRYEYPYLISEDEEIFHESVNSIQPREIEISKFEKIFKTSILDKLIAHRINLQKIEYAIDLLEPCEGSYEMWFFVKTRDNMYCIFYDFLD